MQFGCKALDSRMKGCDRSWFWTGALRYPDRSEATAMTALYVVCHRLLEIRRYRAVARMGLLSQTTSVNRGGCGLYCDGEKRSCERE